MRVEAGATTGASRGAGHLVRQTVLLLASGVVGYAGVLLIGVLLARTVGASGYGSWIVGAAISQAIAVLGLVGTDWILVRQGAYYHGVGDERRLRRTIHDSLFIGGLALAVIALAVVLAAPILGDRVFHDEDLVPVIRLAGLAGFVIGIGNLMLDATQAFKSMRETSLVRALRPVFVLVLVGPVVVLARSVAPAFAALVVAETLLTAVATYSLHRRIPLVGPTLPVERREFLRFAAPAWGNRLVEKARAQLFPLLLGSLAALSATGVFSASRRITAAPTAVTASLTQMYTPMASDAFLRDRLHDLSALYKTVGKWTFALTIPLFCLSVAFPREILSIFGPRFTEDVIPLVLLSVGMMAMSSTGPSQTTLIVIGRPQLALIDYVVVLGVEVGLAVLLIPDHGVVGAAIAAVAGMVLNNVLAAWQVWRSTTMHPYRLDYWKPAAAGLVSLVAARVAAAVVGANAAPLVILVIAGVVLGLTYLGCLVLFGITDDDRAAIQAVLARKRARPAAPVADEPVEITGDELGDEDV
jgi:O-antigen/teichoic acid export membrane protein